MSSNNAANSGQAPLYKIGAVSRLTGLPSNTIRTWERRYQVVEPERTPSGGRVYSDKDVVRLQLIAALLDLDESISSVSGLSEEELRHRIQRHQQMTGNTASPTDTPNPTSRIAIISKDHRVLSDMLTPATGSAVSITYSSDASDGFIQGSANIMVVDLDALPGDPVYEVKTLTKHADVDATIVLYSFCRSLTLVSLSEQGVRLVRKPVNPVILRRLIEDHARVSRILRTSRRSRKTFDELPKEGVDQPRRFTNEQLTRLANIAAETDCECPNHLSTLLVNLVAFEDYSSRCESEGEDDALLHRYLHSQTAKARSFMEVALTHLLEHDGIEL